MKTRICQAAFVVITVAFVFAIFIFSERFLDKKLDAETNPEIKISALNNNVKNHIDRKAEEFPKFFEK